MRKFLVPSIVIFILVPVLWSCGSTSTSNSGTAVTPNTSTPTSAPTSAQHFKVRQTVKVGISYDVTINSAKTSQGDQYTKPKADNIYLIIDVTLKNISSQEENVSSALNFTLQDSTGQKYTETFLSGNTAPDGKVEPNSLLRGQLVYEVPTSMKQYTLGFAADIISGGQTIWDITI